MTRTIPHAPVWSPTIHDQTAELINGGVPTWEARVALQGAYYWLNMAQSLRKSAMSDVRITSAAIARCMTYVHAWQTLYQHLTCQDSSV